MKADEKMFDGSIESAAKITTWVDAFGVPCGWILRFEEGGLEVVEAHEAGLYMEETDE